MNIDGSSGTKTIVTTRPYDFGTDAIERQRVSLGQSLIDADFEYGLQATKWQTYSDIRKYPSFFETPGTDFVVNAISCDAGNPANVTANVSTTVSYPIVGSVLSVQGLASSNLLADRAQGFFIVTSVQPGFGFSNVSYLAKGFIGSNSLLTSYTTIRRGGFYTANSNISSNSTVKVTTYGQVGLTATFQTVTNHGLIPGTPIAITGSLAGNYFIASTPTLSSMAVTVSTSSSVAPGTPYTGNVYVLPYAFYVHRPFDGGVLLSPGIPAHGASAIRQSKKVFRYQSGKGLLWSSGTLVCPNNDVLTVNADGTAIGSNIFVQTSVPHGCPQPGSTIILRGIQTAGYNGTYTVSNVINSTNVAVVATQTLGSANPTLADQPRFIISNWHGSSVRVGTFDDQNGVFWEFDGQTLWVVKRSSTFQTSGFSTCTSGGQILSGTSTRYTTQFKVGDKFTLKGMTHVVTSIQSDTSLTFNPPFRGTNAVTIPSIVCKVKEIRTPQSQFNRDTIDGTGPSGYRVDLTKMQMLGLQYTWYGAGFIDFMIRGGDGNWVYVHRYKQNNINDEAYMRTGNMSVRYEITNECSPAASTLAAPMGAGDTSLTLSDPTTYWPTSGTVLIDNEFVSYSSKSGTTLNGLVRNATLNYNLIDQQSTFSAAAAASHANATSVNIVSITCTPSLTHWGSAFIMDGLFDQDRGYLFNYQTSAFTGINFAPGSSNPLFLIRLAPSVSNGVIGDIGARELFNRAQFLLQRLDVWVQAGSTAGVGNAVFSGVLNPSFVSGNLTTPSYWTAINSSVNGSQPSFAQVYTGAPLSALGSYVAGSGERVFSTICNAGSQYSIDLSGLKEMCNCSIGGNNFFPDGPDTLLVYLTVPTSSPNITQYSVNLFWNEAQA